MNYNNQELITALAAEYVLGTLNGPARKRFQTLMMTSQSVRETTWWWEKRLNGMGKSLAPIRPDENVWLGITQKLGFPAANAHKQAQNVVYLPKQAKKVTAYWATAALLVMALLFGVSQTNSPTHMEAQQVAVFNSDQNDVLWLLRIQQQAIHVQATGNLSPSLEKDYELWMVVADGRPPISLGILPKSGSQDLAKPDLFDQVEISALAVSLEPLGGSPTGSPTQVLYTAPLVSV